MRGVRREESVKKQIYVIGMGPGKEEMMTAEAVAALEKSDVIIGYTVYLELLSDGQQIKGTISISEKNTEQK